VLMILGFRGYGDSVGIPTGFCCGYGIGTGIEIQSPRLHGSPVKRARPASGQQRSLSMWRAQFSQIMDKMSLRLRVTFISNKDWTWCHSEYIYDE